MTVMKQNQLCAYCADHRPKLEQEHIVAKVFYINPPKIGVTVPSCADCNRGRGDGGIRDLHLDEEYMRNLLCLAEGTQGHPVADTLSKTKVLRSFRRSVGLTKTVRETTHLTRMKTEGGLFEPWSSPVGYPDWPRIQRVLRKITKGLYYWSTDKHLPDDYVILANPVVRPIELPLIMKKLDTLGAFGPRNLNEYGVFSFMLASEKNNTARTHWLMRFYDWAVFHTWTLPKVEVPPGATGLPFTDRLEIFR